MKITAFLLLLPLIAACTSRLAYSPPSDSTSAILVGNLRSSDILPDKRLRIGVQEGQCLRWHDLSHVTPSDGTTTLETRIRTQQQVYLQMQGRGEANATCIVTMRFVPNDHTRYLVVTQDIVTEDNAQIFQRVFGGVASAQCAIAILEDSGNRKQVAVRIEDARASKLPTCK